MPLDQNRPYIGTWKLSNQQLVQHTPDALVYLNGDLALPGCAKCNGKIDIQKFLTEVSVDAGTEAGSASATFSLSLPLHHTDSFARDAKFILRPGLEVHVYMRGYFPVAGLYANLAEGQAKAAIQGAARRMKELDHGTDRVTPLPPTVQSLLDNLKFNGEPLDADCRQSVEVIYRQVTAGGLPPAFALAAINQAQFESTWKATATNGTAAYGLFQLNVYGKALGTPSPKFQNGKTAGSAEMASAQPDKYYNAHDPAINTARIVQAAQSKKYRNPRKSPAEMYRDFYFSGLGAGNPPYTEELQHRGEWRGQQGEKAFGKAVWNDPAFSAKIRAEQAQLAAASAAANGTPAEAVEADAPPPAPVPLGPSLLEEMGLPPEVANTLAYPYYPVFHGVVTQVNHSYSGGVSTVSVTCNSILHFWQYHNMSTNASVFGARPTNSKNKMSLVGNNFTGMHPYAIIYSLHYDMAGAAGGVGWALQSKSNQTSTTKGGDSLFSLNVLYWEKRFRKGTRLRMHGATGELFSTMAATWLAKQSSNSLTRLLRNRYNNKTSTPLDIGAKMVGLTSPPAKRAAIKKEGELTGTGTEGQGNPDIQAAVFAPESRPSEESSAAMSVNVLEMQAFVSNIGEWGQVNLFESSYESKLDVAQKVCQITGFEFYQDVDGDFVFKPPMWNLDTSSSRVYRIEDIDIININFSEKEPQVTYMTVKGTAFKNILGTGTDNEWGVRGQYIDYRLVAQFGWRPGSFETNYFNDPKSMFFAAVNRMDVMNIGVNSASVTIPVRPELRPGYPVYIPYLDCHYYCNSFAHSHSVGGQCTTTLQLVGKRAKFHAPGVTSPYEQGMASIKLGETFRPERPLGGYGPDGKPRFLGFPNVVMALDPSEVNPLFWVVGTDIENIKDLRVVKYILKVAQQTGVISEVEDFDPKDPKYTFTRSDGTPVTVFVPNTDVVSKTKTPGDLWQAAQEYAAAMEAAGKEDEKLVGQNDEMYRKVSALYAEAYEIKKDPDLQGNDAKATKKKEQLDAKIRAADKAEDEIEGVLAEQQAAKTAREAQWRQDPVMGVLLELIDTTGEKYRATGSEFQNRGDLSSTINLLDMLSDKKASFSNGQQPGMYRYYSSSHPEKADQGPKRFQYSGKSLESEDPEAFGEKHPAPTVLQFVASDKLVAPQPGVLAPEAALAPGKPEVGIRVLTGDPTEPKGGTVVATSEVTQVMFTSQDVTVTKRVTSTGYTGTVSGMGKAADQKVVGLLALEADPAPSTTVGGAFQEGWFSLMGKLKAADASATAAAKAASPSVALNLGNYGALPASVKVGSGKVVLALPISTYKYDGNPGTVDLGRTISTKPKSYLLGQVQQALAGVHSRDRDRVRGLIPKQMIKGGNKGATDTVVTAYDNAYAIGVAVKAKTKATVTKDQNQVEKTFSPVFPVSDAQGYQVIGSYRYGRGIDVDPEGVFGQLHNQDIFSLLSKDLVEKILTVFVQQKAITVPPMEEVSMGDGKKKVVPKASVRLSGPAATKYLNDEALRQLRAANLTDRQILDYSKALTKGSAPNMLDFNLANFFTDFNLDALHKIPLNNAGYSLADLQFQQSGHVCDCKALEANVQIQAFGQEQFVSVSAQEDPFGTKVSPAENWVRTQAEMAAGLWAQQQQALRGEVLDRGGSHVVSQVQDILGIDTEGHPRESFLDKAVSGAERNADLLEAAKKRAGVQIDNLGRSSGEDQ